MSAPWDLARPAERDFFARLGDGLVAVLPPGRAAPPRDGEVVFPHGGVWIHVGGDGGVRAFAGKVEVGQGTRAALALMVAEELRAPLSTVRVELGDTDLAPWDIGTFGSRSMPDAGAHLRTAAAGALALLRRLAAERLAVDERALAAGDGRFTAGDRAVGYGELVRGMRRVETIDPATPAGDPRAWTIAGRHALDPAAVEAVTGARKFTSDLRRPGMLHGKILRPPAHRAKLRSLDLAAARALPGVTVVHEGDLVAVAAGDLFAAVAALDAVRAEWDLAPLPPEGAIADWLRAHPTEGEGFWGATHHEAGDVDGALAAAPLRAEATYTTAYIAHAPLECRCAIAEWEGDRVTVWTGTQQPFGVRAEVAEALALPEARVRVVVAPTGAGFGGKHTGETAIAAAKLARAAGRPVRILWTREEEFAWAYLRPLAVIDVRAGALADGTLTAWEFRNLNSGSAAIRTPYRVAHQRIDHQPADSPLPQGPYRALAATANAFARESHVDALAARAGADPVAWRLRHLDDERLAAVLRACAERAGWATRRRAPGRGSGIACAVEKEGRVATFAEVSVDGARRLTVDRVVTAFECGAIVHPANLGNQIVGATVMGLGGALFEAIRFDGGRVLNGRFSQYRVPRFADVPPIEVVLVDRRDLPPAGGGETPLIAVAPALANAICDATGVRLRALPLVPDGVVPAA